MEVKVGKAEPAGPILLDKSLENDITKLNSGALFFL